MKNLFKKHFNFTILFGIVFSIIVLLAGCSRDWQCEVKYAWNCNVDNNGKRIQTNIHSKTFSVAEGYVTVTKDHNDKNDLTVKIYDDSWWGNASVSGGTSQPYGSVMLSTP